MNKKLVENLVNTTQLGNVIGVEARAVRKTYLSNPNKAKMIKALAFGTYLMEHNFTSEEVKDAVALIHAQRLRQYEKGLI